MAEPKTLSGDAYRKKCAANDLLGFSSGIALLMKGLESRLREDELERTLTEEQEERLRSLLMQLHRLADDVADLAREIVEESGP